MQTLTVSNSRFLTEKLRVISHTATHTDTGGLNVFFRLPIKFNDVYKIHFNYQMSFLVTVNLIQSIPVFLISGKYLLFVFHEKERAQVRHLSLISLTLFLLGEGGTGF